MDNLAYKEETRYEMYNGRLVAMSPRAATNHNVVLGNIFCIFRNFLRGRACTPFTDTDVYLTENDSFVPDVMIVCNRDIVKTDGIYGAPDLVVEILSPSTAKKDKGYKKDLYEKCGVKEYWIVEVETQSIEVYLLQDGKYALSDV
jgi:Uma2 family endonuclease